MLFSCALVKRFGPLIMHSFAPIRAQKLSSHKKPVSLNLYKKWFSKNILFLKNIRKNCYCGSHFLAWLVILGNVWSKMQADLWRWANESAAWGRSPERKFLVTKHFFPKNSQDRMHLFFFIFENSKDYFDYLSWKSYRTKLTLFTRHRIQRLILKFLRILK